MTERRPGDGLHKCAIVALVPALAREETIGIHFRNRKAESKAAPATGRAIGPAISSACIPRRRAKSSRAKQVGAAVIGPRPGDRLLDVGCGTGTLALRLKTIATHAEIVGIDPDPTVLARARAKPGARGIDWHEGFLTKEFLVSQEPFSSAVSSLVLHQTPSEEKARILKLMFDSLRDGGLVHIADYGRQRTALMRYLFRSTVQRLDGVEDTQPNADGVLPKLITQAGFQDVAETKVTTTLTGSISLYRGRKP